MAICPIAEKFVEMGEVPFAPTKNIFSDQSSQIRKSLNHVNQGSDIYPENIFPLSLWERMGEGR